MKKFYIVFSTGPRLNPKTLVFASALPDQRPELSSTRVRTDVVVEVLVLSAVVDLVLRGLISTLLSVSDFFLSDRQVAV